MDSITEYLLVTIGVLTICYSGISSFGNKALQMWAALASVFS